MPLTLQNLRAYSARQVLSTPKLKRLIASEIVVFLRPLFSMVGRAANTTPEQSGNMPADFSRLIAPDRLHFASGQLPIKELKP